MRVKQHLPVFMPSSHMAKKNRLSHDLTKPPTVWTGNPSRHICRNPSRIRPPCSKTSTRASPLRRNGNFFTPRHGLAFQFGNRLEVDDVRTSTVGTIAPGRNAYSGCLCLGVVAPNRLVQTSFELRLTESRFPIASRHPTLIAIPRQIVKSRSQNLIDYDIININ